MVKNMVEFKAYRGRALRIAVGLMVLMFLMAGGAEATKFIRDDATGGDCTSFGIWNAATKTCLMTTDLIRTDALPIIQIYSNGVTLDGNGHTITGNGVNGVYIFNMNGVNIKNLNVKLCPHGVYVHSSNNINLININASNNGNGIFVCCSNFNSRNNMLIGNTVSNNSVNGISLSGSNNTLIGNTASNNLYGLNLQGSNNTLIDNTASNNSNGGIGLTVSNNNTLIDNNASNNPGFGILLSGFNNTLIGNTASYNSVNGIDLSEDSNTLIGNNASNNIGFGISVFTSSSNILIGNNASNNTDSGIIVWNSGGNNNLTGNTVSNNNGSGISLSGSASNTLIGNTISNNNVSGINMERSSSNTIYNNFFNNTNNFEIDNFEISASAKWNITKTPSINIVGGSYLGGNFWANPAGSGFSQSCTDADKDGICDAQYTLDSNNIDYLPLSMNFNKDSVSPANITNLTNITYAPTYINFTWTNPPDPDYHHVMLFLNSTFFMNITALQNYYNVTGLTPDTEYELGTHTVDRSGNINETWVNKTARTAPISGTKYSISLASGWNLISVPLMPEDSGIASVLSLINGNYSIVWAYNASDTADHWKKFDPGAPFGNDLTTMEAGRGYWIMMTSDNALNISGTVPESTDINLKVGWNLIGYNSLDSQPIADAFSSIAGNYSIVWAYDASDTADHWKKYDPSAPFGNDLANMEPGKGYWIMMTTDDILEI